MDSAGKFQEMVWEGVTRRVSQMLTLEVGRLEQNQQELDEKMKELNTQNTQMKKEMNSKFEQLECKLEMILDRLK